MAGRKSPLPEEEVFMGRAISIIEEAKSTLFGQFFYSPSTPRDGRANHPNRTNRLPTTLPDVLNESTSTADTFNSTGDLHNAPQPPRLNDTSSVIDLESDNDSIQIISDTESFIVNEKEVFESCKALELEKNSDSGDNRKTEENDSVLTDPSLYDNGSVHNESMSLSGISPNREDPDSSSLQNKSEYQNDANESSFSNVTSGSMSIEALLAASVHLERYSQSFTKEVDDNTSLTEDPPKENTVTIDKEFSLNAISDSVLNISHGSSPSSSLVEPNLNNLGLLANAIYEDISYDADHMFQLPTQTDKSELKEPDLHMSVDEIDFHVQNVQPFKEIQDISKSTLFESCSNESNFTNFYSVCNSEANNLSSLKKTSSSFHSYRETVDDSFLMEGVNKIDLDVNDENINETSFEAVRQNRQNSFTSPVQPLSSSLKKIEESETQKNVTKQSESTHIPVLKPSKFQIKPKSTKHNYNWAKKLPTYEKRNPTSAHLVTSKPSYYSTTDSKSKVATPTSKIPKNTICSGNKTPASCSLLPMAKSGSKIPCPKSVTPRNVISAEKKSTFTNSFIPLNKTGPTTPFPTNNVKTKTPVTNSTVKSTFGETPRSLKPPAKKLCLSDKKTGNAVANLEKERYKNVISPVRAYINGAPAVIQRKAQFIKEEKVVGDFFNSQIPEMCKTPTIKQQTTVQKFNYRNDQENMDPNYTRDTLPPRIFEHANAVFMKEPEPPKRHLPKMGEKMMKLVDTPRPKVIHHEGRVTESPREKGVLIPNILVTASTPNQDLETPGRISVRIVKTTEP